MRLKDPLRRMYQYLVNEKVWDEDKEKALRLSIGEEVTQAVQDYLNVKSRKPETMFDHLYAKLPDCYQSQRDELVLTEKMEQEGHEG